MSRERKSTSDNVWQPAISMCLASGDFLALIHFFLKAQHLKIYYRKKYYNVSGQRWSCQLFIFCLAVYRGKWKTFLGLNGVHSAVAADIRQCRIFLCLFPFQTVADALRWLVFQRVFERWGGKKTFNIVLVSCFSADKLTHYFKKREKKKSVWTPSGLGDCMFMSKWIKKRQIPSSSWHRLQGNNKTLTAAASQRRSAVNISSPPGFHSCWAQSCCFFLTRRLFQSTTRSPNYRRLFPPKRTVLTVVSSKKHNVTHRCSRI